MDMIGVYCDCPDDFCTQAHIASVPLIEKWLLLKTLIKFLHELERVRCHTSAERGAVAVTWPRISCDLAITTRYCCICQLLLLSPANTSFHT